MAENPSEEGMQVDEDDFILSLSPGEGTGNGVSEVIATEVTDLPADLVNTDVSELVEADNSSLWLTLEGSLSGAQDLETVDTVDALSTVGQADIASSVIGHDAFAEDSLIQSEDVNPAEETMEVEMPHIDEMAADKGAPSSTPVDEEPFIEISQSTESVDIPADMEFQTPTADIQRTMNLTNSRVSTVVLTQASQQLQSSQSQVFYSVQSSGVGGVAASALRLVNTVSSGAKPIASVVSAAGITGQQPIRLLSPAKTITLQQAQQLGLFSPRKAPTIAISKVAISSTGTFATVTSGSSTIAAARQPGKLALPAGNLTAVKNPILRTPTKIAPAPPQPTTSGQQPTSLFIKNAAGQVTMATLVTKTGSPTVASSPQKIVLRPATPSSVASSPAKVSGQPAQYIRLTTAQAVAAGILPGVGGTPTGTGQLQIGNSKIQLVRLVTPGASSGNSSVTTPLSPAVASTAASSLKVVPKTTGGGAASRVTTPVKSVATPVSSTQGAQRLLLPAGSLNSLAGGNLVVVPAQYVTQQQVSVASSSTSSVQSVISSADGVSSGADIKPQLNSVKSSQPKVALERSPSESSTSQSQGSKTPASLDANGIKPRKPCNCTKSQCLKLYCDCFANGEFCNGCNCVSCANNLEHEELRSRAVRACLDRNPQAFKPKIGVSWGPEPRRHNKGCHCKRSSCLKNYCECYEAKIACTAICKCVGCKNCFDGEPVAVTPEKKTIKSGPPAFQYTLPEPVVPITIKTEERVPVDVPTSRGPPALSSTGTRPAFSFITQEVVEATCQCLLAQAEEAEKAGKDTIAAEGMVLEEFGRCLLQIIEYAAKAKSTL